MASVPQPPRTRTARQLILELGEPEGGFAPIYHGILKNFDSVSEINNFMQSSRPANEHWKVEKNAASVLWPIFLGKIPYFQEVIVAVRPRPSISQPKPFPLSISSLSHIIQRL
jgi:hypothetical protein